MKMVSAEDLMKEAAAHVRLRRSSRDTAHVVVDLIEAIERLTKELAEARSALKQIGLLSVMAEGNVAGGVLAASEVGAICARVLCDRSTN